MINLCCTSNIISAVRFLNAKLAAHCGVVRHRRVSILVILNLLLVFPMSSVVQFSISCDSEFVGNPIVLIELGKYVI